MNDMKQYRKYILAAVLYFVICGTVLYFLGSGLTKNTANNRTAFMNRMTAQINETGSTSTDSFENTFAQEDIADTIEVTYFNESSFPTPSNGSNNTYVWLLQGENGSTQGFVTYTYNSGPNAKVIVLIEAALLISVVPLIIFAVIVDRKILRPFRDFSEYPEKLSKGISTEGIPETKNRLFGKYVWGMNMLNEKLEADRRQIGRLLYDRKQFVSVIAHGIKTPAANIKLYSEAIETGLYRDGVPDEKDKEIAQKIGKNADDIAKLVSEMLDDPGSLKSSYEPEINSFYLADIKSRVADDFSNRLKVSNIPFSIELQGNPMVTSDFEAVVRCITQIMENAIKYGDGTGIAMKMYRQDDMTFISIRNNGTSLSESEIPFVFNCYWRGSNSDGKEGSGIGLFEARSIIRTLGGDIMMRIEDNTTEVLIYL